MPHAATLEIASGGAAVDRSQHLVQDAAEHYAVYSLHLAAEKLGAALDSRSDRLWEQFAEQLERSEISLAEFTSGKYRKYKGNVDAQAPPFVARVVRHLDARVGFELDEATQRNLGKKADFFLEHDGEGGRIPFSLKNYIGAGGIARPQVASGTFLSFANSFVFVRAGVGKYEDPRPGRATFMGSSREDREDVLEYLRLSALKRPLRKLEDINARIRSVFLGPDFEMFDQEAYKSIVSSIVPEAQEAVLQVFDIVGLNRVRDVVLGQIGMDGSEEAFFFDSKRSVDSLTSVKYRALRDALNSSSTTFEVRAHRQGIRLEFSRSDEVVLETTVPLTVNANGAWHRPSQRYSGTQVKLDKGLEVELRWGQRRPRKCREIATSTNTYVNLKSAGIFD